MYTLMHFADKLDQEKISADLPLFDIDPDIAEMKKYNFNKMLSADNGVDWWTNYLSGP
jgi:hypothetical protein